MRAAKWAVQMHGGIGFADECDVGLFLKRIMCITSIYRTPQAHRRRVAEAITAPDGPDLFKLFRADMPEDKSFRAEVREFVREALPSRLRDLPVRAQSADADWWHAQLLARGWIAPAWPREHGGMEASAAQRLILFEELAMAAAPEISSQGIYHIGPILMRFGSQAQMETFLPKTLSGEIRWCQGYSEPNAGSDLAALSTKAVLDGDAFVVNGQKIWTTGAQSADWMFALVRTDPQASDRREGISMMLIDMKSPGVRVRPIRTIAGDEEYCEVFFDDVRVPAHNIVSGVNQGWKLANALLETERLMTSSPQRLLPMLAHVHAVARASGAAADAVFADRLAGAEIDVLAYCAAFAGFLERLRGGEGAGPQVSILKIAMADYLQALADLLLEAAGSDAALLAPLDADGRAISVALSFLQSRRASIYGGSSEIQRNIVARRVLNLGEPGKR